MTNSAITPDAPAEARLSPQTSTDAVIAAYIHEISERHHSSEPVAEDPVSVRAD
jgi:hypothetical protein